MIIDAIDSTRNLIKTDVVESFKTRAIDLPDAVIRDQKLLLPPHEHILPVCAILIVKARSP